ncbi:excisionase family DNA-binding protein [Chloroflexota bacterium]
MQQQPAVLTYSVSECADILGISKGLCYQLVREGRIPSLRLGRRLIIPKTALEKLLNGEGTAI